MTRAVLIDALGTIVELRPPGRRLQALLAAEGLELSEDRAAAGFGAEIGYYLEHHLEGSTPAGLEDLRDRCATVLLEALELPGLDHATARRVMLAALEFEAYPDAAPALAALGELGVRRVIASNWDRSLPEWLGPTGVLDLVDGVVTSADVGSAKPAPEVFERALELAGVEAGDALHVGDSLDNDVAGARAAGIRAVLVQRTGEAPDGVTTLRSLEQLPSVLS